MKRNEDRVACVTLFASDYRRMAGDIEGNWALAVGVGFVAGLSVQIFPEAFRAVHRAGQLVKTVFTIVSTNCFP